LNEKGAEIAPDAPNTNGNVMDWQTRESIKDIYFLGFPLAFFAAAVIVAVSIGIVWAAFSIIG
jgi:dolichyl-phosphate-mannose--protein O-mannosyl transferase